MTKKLFALLICKSLPCSVILWLMALYTWLFIVGLFRLFRLSNLVPQSQTAFDITRHLTVGDVILDPPGDHVLLRWHKAMQSAQALKVVQIPQLQDHYVCPVQAMNTMLSRQK